VNGAKGHSALQLSRDLDCQYKTAFVLAHKLREVVAAEAKGRSVGGEIEVDGAYFGGHVRPANRVEDHVDRRKAMHQTGKRRVVVTMRERNGSTVTATFKSEAGFEKWCACVIGWQKSKRRIRPRSRARHPWLHRRPRRRNAAPEARGDFRSWGANAGYP